MADIRMTFKGQEWVIPARKAFRVCEDVEDIASITEVTGWYAKPRFAKLARCCGVLLRAAGAEFSDEEVKGQLLADYAQGRPQAVFHAVMALQSVIFDGMPEDMKPGKADIAEPPGKPDAS